MEAENEEEKSISITPCSTTVRKNLLSRFENSEDSGFFSATPSSREQSYKSHCDSSNKSNDNYFMTPISGNTSDVQMTPGVSSHANPYSYEKCSTKNNLFRKVDHEDMMDLYYSPILDTFSQREMTEISEMGDKTTYMECDESFYGDHVAKDLPCTSCVSKQTPDNAVNASHVLHVLETTGVTDDVKVLFPDVMTSPEMPSTPLPIKKITVKSPKTKSPVRTRRQSSKYLLKRILLTGLERIDVLYFLGQKENHVSIVSKIFSYLSDSDLLNVSAVSKTWEQICLNDLQARRRLQLYKKARADFKENLKTAEIGFQRRGSRTLFSQIQNFPASSSRRSPMRTPSPTVSPRSLRFKLFCKEGEKLDKGSKLMPCPHCTLPARCSTGNLGQCLCKTCQYRFCTSCLSDFHHPTRCYRISSCPSRTRQNMIIGSKASKRRLSRT